MEEKMKMSPRDMAHFFLWYREKGERLGLPIYDNLSDERKQELLREYAELLEGMLPLSDDLLELLSTGVRNALKAEGITSLVQLVETSQEQILRIDNIGRRGLAEIRKLLWSYGYYLQ
ncbi:MAG: hypothetical protein UW87_C0042G0002 [Candidatus Moranbacteria bacterium GW2011_GWC2_45_10]|nr:MAG: hypothetical protein UW87_C0042G0002 [Candidatus Moranbacteria bacterium GW2011_GWC2_45_10]